MQCTPAHTITKRTHYNTHYMCTLTHTLNHAYTCTCTSAHAITNIHTTIHITVHAHTCTESYIYMYMYIFTYYHKCTHYNTMHTSTVRQYRTAGEDTCLPRRTLGFHSASHQEILSQLYPSSSFYLAFTATCIVCVHEPNLHLLIYYFHSYLEFCL